MLLTAEQLSKNYGMRQLVDKVSLYLNDGEKLGIIGLNGTGKSTLLRLLAGIEEPDEGSVTHLPNVRIAYLHQSPAMLDELSVIDQVLFGLSSIEKEERRYEAATILTKLAITDFDKSIGTLSGGQRKRVALAQVLMQKADALILDEPTNHLDSDMVAWLEQYLIRYNGGIIMVTHDRYLLERVATRIVELSRAHLYSYEANYSTYLSLKAERMEMEQASERKRQTVLRREYEWIMRGARARSTKSTERITRYEALRDKEAPQKESTVQMAAMSSRLGKKTVALNEVSKAYDGRTVIKPFSYGINRDDRIGIVGKNGAGKSTLLNIIAGNIQPDCGSVEIGATVKLGYFTQEGRELDESLRVYDYISAVASEVRTAEGTLSATQMLERFLFTSEMQFSTINKLSGGERRRLNLLAILMEAPNILLLDEPTNDLDIETLTIVEDYIDSFPGAVLAVSHDRYFLDKVATAIFEVRDDGEVRRYSGNYAAYEEKRVVDVPVNEKKESAQKKDVQLRPQKLKFTFKEQREFETIDGDIAALEGRIAALEKELKAAASDYVRLQELTAKKESLNADLDSLTERWVYLQEIFEQIEK